MFEHILATLDRAGWELQELGGWHCAVNGHQGFLFGALSDLDQDWWAIPQKRKQVHHWNIIVICSEGLDSSYLRRPFPDRVQLWFWDIQTGEVFPYPPTRDFTIMHWLEKIARGEAVSELPVTRQTRPNRSNAWISYLLIGLNVLVFLLMSLAGGSTNEDVLIRFGAKVDSLIQAGQVWRLLTSAFIHIGILHLAFNMYALWIVGPLTEKMFGHRRFLIIYLLSAIGGSTASYLFSPALSAGASGAIFGLFGALLVHSWQRPQLWKSGLGMNLLVVIGINLFLGIVQPGIDNYAHLGGLLTGLIFSLISSRIST